MEEMKSRVYILTDEHNNVVRIEGEYSLPSDLTGWILIEEGDSCDRLNHAQNNYLPKPIMDWEHGLYRYKWTGSEIVEKDLTEEIESRRIQKERSEEIYRLKDFLSSTDYIITKAYEVALEGGDPSSVYSEYKYIIGERKSARERINELEALTNPS